MSRCSHTNFDQTAFIVGGLTGTSILVRALAEGVRSLRLQQDAANYARLTQAQLEMSARYADFMRIEATESHLRTARELLDMERQRDELRLDLSRITLRLEAA